jgi:hypothetical protein
MSAWDSVHPPGQILALPGSCGGCSCQLLTVASEEAGRSRWGERPPVVAEEPKATRTVPSQSGWLGASLFLRGPAPGRDDHQDREGDQRPPGDAQCVVLPLQDVPHVVNPNEPRVWGGRTWFLAIDVGNSVRSKLLASPASEAGWLPALGRGPNAGPIQKIFAVLGVWTVRSSSPSPTTCGFLP